MVVLSAALLVPLLILGNAGDGGVLDPAVLVLLAVVGVLLEGLTASSIRTAAGPNGVAIRFGLLGWPRCTYRIEQIEHAEVIDLPVWHVAYGFWWTPSRTSCTIRSGPALRLLLRTGRTVTITVPDAHAAVAAVDAARSA
jgi:hypothetical protein